MPPQLCEPGMWAVWHWRLGQAAWRLAQCTGLLQTPNTHTWRQPSAQAPTRTSRAALHGIQAGTAPGGVREVLLISTAVTMATWYVRHPCATVAAPRRQAVPPPVPCSIVRTMDEAEVAEVAVPLPALPFPTAAERATPSTSGGASGTGSSPSTAKAPSPQPEPAPSPPQVSDDPLGAMAAAAAPPPSLADDPLAAVRQVQCTSPPRTAPPATLQTFPLRWLQGLHQCPRSPPNLPPPLQVRQALA